MDEAFLDPSPQEGLSRQCQTVGSNLLLVKLKYEFHIIQNGTKMN